MSSRNSRSGAYKYASNKGNASRPHFDKAGDRRAKDAILKNFSTKYDLPAGAFISETHNSLAKIMVPYESTDPRAPVWRGAVIDYEHGFVVKPGVRSQIVRADDLDAFLATLESSSKDTFEYVPFVGGAFVSLFKYNGTVYNSTGRSLGFSHTHPGAVSVADSLASIVKVDGLFEKDVGTYTTSYDFILLTPGTLDVTKADLALPSVIISGTTTLSSDVHGSPRTTQLPIDNVLGADDFYPTKAGASYRAESLTVENAKKWLSGEVTGAPEELLVTRTTSNGDKFTYRLQPQAAYDRHLLRGDVADVTTRFVQLLSEYEFSYDATTDSEILIPTHGKNEVIHLSPRGGLTDLQVLAHNMEAVLPLSRKQDVARAVSNVNTLTTKLTQYFSAKTHNDNHPAAEYYNEFHKYTKAEMAKKLWTLPENTLFASLRWYKLV
jgi:hypothetical protein